MSITPFKLEVYLARHEFTAKYLLCCSDAESFKMNDIVAMASPEDKNAWDNLQLGYTESPGLPILRQTVAEQIYPGLAADNVLMFAGAEDGIFCALHALIDAGDNVIVLTPAYQSLVEIPANKGADVTEIQLSEEHEWHIDLNAIKSALKPNTKCIVINFPHNPTGQVITQEELEGLIEICKTRGIWLFSDEVYRLLGKPENPWAQPAACLYDKALSLGVMSKSFGMPGLRIGWIACQARSALKKIERVKHYTSICNSAPAEILSLIALRNKDKILARNNEIVASNLQILDSFFAEYSQIFTWVKPQGGCVGFVRYNRKETVDEFANSLVREKSVLLLPASVYNHNSNHFRIGFGRKNMSESLAKLEEFLQ